MKIFAQFFVFCCVLLQLISALQARLFLAQNGRIYCKWSNRGLCNKFVPYCVQITTYDATTGLPTYTCKHYKNECKFLIDKCLAKTAFNAGDPVAFSPNCINIKIGASDTCGV